MLHKLKKLSSGRQLVLGSSLLTLLAVIMPWHSIGVATLGTENNFNGFGDQNLVIGLIVFIAALVQLLVVGLPILGFRLPRLPWHETTLLTFLSAESAFLISILIVMHATSISRVVNYDLRIGIQLALIATIAACFGSQLISRETAPGEEGGYHAPLTHVPHRRDDEDYIRSEQERAREDARMKLDL